MAVLIEDASPEPQAGNVRVKLDSILMPHR